MSGMYGRGGSVHDEIAHLVEVAEETREFVRRMSPQGGQGAAEAEPRTANLAGPADDPGAIEPLAVDGEVIDRLDVDRLNIDRLDVVYCEGWDPQARGIVGSLPLAEAEMRDRTGEQYAVVLSADRPMMLIEAAWQRHYLAGWLIDEQLRRMRVFEFRSFEPGELFMTRHRMWEYEPGDVEFGDSVCRTLLEATYGRGLRMKLEPRGSVGGMTQTARSIDPADFRMVMPEFGDWAGFLPLLGALKYRVCPEPVLTVREPAGTESMGLPVGQRPWRPPAPLQPADLDLLFTEGARYVPEEESWCAGDVRLQNAGVLRMPSGRLVAADPGSLEPDMEPFTVTVPPGSYPVLLSLVGKYKDIAAAKLVVKDEPVDSWELALVPGQDMRFLNEGEFFGFGVDSGTGCFVDAAAVGAMRRIIEESGYAAVSFDDGVAVEVTDPESGMNLIAYVSGHGDGSYPTWIGRTGNGDVACFVADMLTVRGVLTRPSTTSP